MNQAAAIQMLSTLEVNVTVKKSSSIVLCTSKEEEEEGEGGRNTLDFWGTHIYIFRSRFLFPGCFVWSFHLFIDSKTIFFLFVLVLVLGRVISYPGDDARLFAGE